jgi:hypothetical protein
MKYIANVVSSTKIEYPITFNVVDSIDKTIPELPTLVIDFKLMKEHFPDVSALNKKYNNLIYWTYSKKVDRQSYVLDTKNFIHTSYNIFKSKPKYFFVDLIQMKSASIKKLILKIKNTTKFYYYENNRMIYIYCDNFIFGIDKELLIYIGLNPLKIFNKIKKLSNGTLVKNDIIIKYKEELTDSLENNKYIPYFAILNE